jgi:hypothetical protein
MFLFLLLIFLEFGGGKALVGTGGGGGMEGNEERWVQEDRLQRNAENLCAGIFRNLEFSFAFFLSSLQEASVRVGARGRVLNDEVSGGVGAYKYIFMLDVLQGLC